MIWLNIGLSWKIIKIHTTPLVLEIDLCSATSMESSQRDLLNDRAEHNLPWKITNIKSTTPVLVSHPKQVQHSPIWDFVFTVDAYNIHIYEGLIWISANTDMVWIFEAGDKFKPCVILHSRSPLRRTNRGKNLSTCGARRRRVLTAVSTISSGRRHWRVPFDVRSVWERRE